MDYRIIENLEMFETWRNQEIEDYLDEREERENDPLHTDH